MKCNALVYNEVVYNEVIYVNALWVSTVFEELDDIVIPFAKCSYRVSNGPLFDAVITGQPRYPTPLTYLCSRVTP